MGKIYWPFLFLSSRETIAEHLLVVAVKDQGTPARKNYAHVYIHVHDHNDHAPMFASPIVQGKVYETADVGTTVARVLAVDRDRDDNARIGYSIISGKFPHFSPSRYHVVRVRKFL